MSHTNVSTPDDRKIRRIAMASAIGTMIEWYDFFLFGVLATLVLNKVFFPTVDPIIGTLLSYTTFAIGFIARPIGGLIFGHFGDRIGRKKVLILTLLIMGVATFLIGALPGYATLGVSAPLLLLLLRILQGIGIGGEWGGAVVLAIEHSPANRRSYFGAFPQLGVPVGLMSSAGVVALLNLLPHAQFMAWGWRVAFLLSAILVAVGLFIRMRVMESPEFLKLLAEDKRSSLPALDMFRQYPRAIVLTLGARYVEGACFNMFGIFIIPYVVGTLHLTQGFALGGVILASALMIPFILISGALADRYGMKKIFAIGCILVGLTSLASFAVMQAYGSAHPYLVWLSIVVPLSLAYPLVYGPESSLFASQFGANVRYTGVSFAYQFSGIFASGLTPIVATILLQKNHGSPWYIVIYMLLVSLISLVSVLMMRVPRPEDAMALGDQTMPVRS